MRRVTMKPHDSVTVRHHMTHDNEYSIDNSNWVAREQNLSRNHHNTRPTEAESDD